MTNERYHYMIPRVDIPDSENPARMLLTRARTLLEASGVHLKFDDAQRKAWHRPITANSAMILAGLFWQEMDTDEHLDAKRKCLALLTPENDDVDLRAWNAESFRAFFHSLAAEGLTTALSFAPRHISVETTLLVHRRGQNSWIDVRQDGALPLVVDDHVKMEVTACDPIFLYIIAIDGDGTPTICHPWRQRKADDRPIGQLNFPTPALHGIPHLSVNAMPGPEVVVTIGNHDPIPAANLNAIFVDLPRQLPSRDPTTIASFDLIRCGQPRDVSTQTRFDFTVQPDRLDRLATIIGRRVIEHGVAYATMLCVPKAI